MDYVYTMLIYMVMDLSLENPIHRMKKARPVAKK